MKLLAAVDKDSAPIHSIVVTAANVQDLTPAFELPHGAEEVMYGDASYEGIAKRPEMAGKATELRVTMQPCKSRAVQNIPDGRLQDLIQTAKAQIRSKVEHRFSVIKQQFRFQKTQLRGLAKNAARSTSWQHYRICSRHDGNCSQQSD
jgi:IS5 family transposase